MRAATAIARLMQATAESRLGNVAAKLSVALAEHRYRPDQPRAPRGSSIVGWWIDDLGNFAPSAPDDEPVLIGARRLGARCDGFTAGCQNGGSFGTSAIVHLEAGRRLCWACAIKWFGVENEDEDEDQKWKTLTDFDPTLKIRYPR